MSNTSFLEAQKDYETMLASYTTLVGTNSSLDPALGLVNQKLAIYQSATTPSETATATTNLNAAFTPVSDYYVKLSKSITSLQNYINTSAKNIDNSSPRLINEERYTNSIHPEESMEAREASYSFFPELRMASLPYLISISVFMASLSIFLIVNMSGFTGQVNIPQSLTQMLSSPASSQPFFQSPMFIAGISILVLITIVIIGVLYYKAKNTNNG
jgi:hypothetical protein